MYTCLYLISNILCSYEDYVHVITMYMFQHLCHNSQLGYVYYSELRSMGKGIS